jgi:hypothetical protein
MRREPRAKTREDVIIALHEARGIAERTLRDAPEFKRGFVEAMDVAIDIVRAFDGLNRAIDDRPLERR